jgi:hypothetical protein
LQSLAESISEAAADPGDRGKLASLILANSGFGAMDAAIAMYDGRTPDSLVPLEALLRQREDVLESEAHPFSFEPVKWNTIEAPPPVSWDQVNWTPVTWTNAPTPPPATFTPATAAQAPMPNFSGVQVPQPNTTPFNPASIPTSAPKPASTYDSTKQNYIATGNTTAANNQQFVNSATGQALTAEERAQIPDYALQSMIDSGLIARMEEGGLFNQGMVTPFGNNQFGPASQAIQRYRQNRPSRPQGGQPTRPAPQRPESGQALIQTLSSNPRLQQALAMLQSPMSAPPAGQPGMPPSTPQTQPVGQPQVQGAQDGQQVIQMLTQQLAANPQLAQVAQLLQRLPALGAQPAGYPPSTPTTQPVGQPQVEQPAGVTTPFSHPSVQALMERLGGLGLSLPQAETGGMMQGAYIGDEEGPEIHIPLGPGMALVIPNKKYKQAKGKTKGTKKMAEGGLFEEQGKSMYEGLLSDTDRTRAQNFLNEASRRAALGTPFDINRLPTPVFASSPGTSPFVGDLLASLNAISRGIPQGYFKEQANLLRPAGYSEGVIGRTR